MQEEKAKTIVSLKSEITGNVKFGQGCIVHPSSAILAEGGDIIFGDYNIIEERVTIVNKKNKDPSKNKPMTIGSFNLFEVGTKIDSSEIGNMNHFEPRSKEYCLSISSLNLKGVVEQDCIIKDKSTIGATVKLPSSTSIDFKNIYFPDKVVSELKFDEQRYKNQMVSMYSALAKLIPANNPVKEM